MKYSINSLFKKPCFRAEEAHKLGVSSALLGYYVKTGLLQRIRRGVYRSAKAIGSTSFRWADLIEAVSSIKHGVICLISALAIYELTEEIPREHWIAIPHATSIPPAAKAKIIRLRDTEMGMTKIKLEGTTIPIYDKERTIIDAFRFLSLETAIKALRSALALRGKNRLDLGKLEQYARRFRVKIDPYVLSMTT